MFFFSEKQKAVKSRNS